MSETGELLNPGTIEKATDLFHKLAGPVFEEFGAILGDKVKVYRVKNMIKTTLKTQRLLLDAGLPVNAVPPRLLLPIIENCSVEDNETLQDLWAGLLATASQESDLVSPSFVDSLKQLTPVEARFMEKLYSDFESMPQYSATREMPINPFTFTVRGGAPTGVSSDTFERLGLIRRDFDVKMQSRGTPLMSAITLDDAFDTIANTEAEIRHKFLFTGYAVKFMKACHGPQR